MVSAGLDLIRVVEDVSYADLECFRKRSTAYDGAAVGDALEGEACLNTRGIVERRMLGSNANDVCAKNRPVKILLRG